MRVKSPHAGSLRFPAQRSSAQGESVPKVRQKCVTDGKQVNIPVLILFSDGRTEKARSAGCWLSRFKRVGRTLWQIREFIFQGATTISPFGVREVIDATLPGKVPKRLRKN